MMPMISDSRIRVMIVDDNLAAIEVLAATIARRYGRSLTVVATATNSADASVAIERTRPDLLFLDVELPDCSGLDYARALRQRYGAPMRIVMYTSYEKYMIGALRAEAFDFMLKPLDEAELDTVITRYVAARGADAASSAAMQQPVAPMPVGRRLMITTATNGKLVLSPDSVGYFRYLSDRKRWEVVLDTLQTYALFGQTTADDILAFAHELVRIHKAYIININHLALIQDNKCVMMPPFDRVDELHVSKNYRRELTDRFYSL